ncbi:C40 family peptidase [Streptomyces yerevanensis]|uniref:C40 family peptidase n=1 Tax=Streptomyces yerevanensis TaxID=66378 RepID=UPI000526FEC4|nr:NlpC/P60 family protein [Streptomyces yerevanensis]
MAGKKKSRPVVSGLVVLVLVAASGYLTVELRKEEEQGVTQITNVGVLDGSGRSAGPSDDKGEGEQAWSRLQNPARSVLRGSDGQVSAVFTDGARTATLTGPARTFAEPSSTNSEISTTDWVRLMPEPWTKGAEKQKWFKDWYAEYKDSKEDDLFAFATQYQAGAQQKKDADGIVYAGDANFGPLNTAGGADLRLEQSDFYDYLGIPYPFRDGATGTPEAARARSIDCSGYMRMVFGYRARYPLMSSDDSGDGLPRTANGMARSKEGVDVLPLTGIAAKDRPSNIDQLQPGDLVFFKLDTRTGQRLDHVGMVLGYDTEGHLIFISSREEINGPTIGDVGGASRLDGNGYYAKTLRSAKRL